MSKVFALLAIICGLGATGLGFMNSEKLKATRADLEAAQSAAKSAEEIAATKTKEADAAKAAEQQAQAAKAAAESALSSKEAELKSARSEVAQIKAELDAKNQEIASVQAKLDETLAKISTDTSEEAAAESAPAPSEIEDLKTQVAELETVRQSLTSELETAKSRVATLEQAEAARVAGIMKKSTEGRVLAVNSVYNFVVLSLGDRQGAAPNAELLIKRGGNLIGKAVVTSVERGQSIADVMLDSVPRGVRVQPGDTVVFQGD